MTATDLVNLDELEGPAYHELSRMQPAFVREGEFFRPMLLRCALNLTAVVDDLNANHYGPSPAAQLVCNELVYLEPATARWTPTQGSHLAQSLARARGGTKGRTKSQPRAATGRRPNESVLAGGPGERPARMQTELPALSPTQPWLLGTGGKVPALLLFSWKVPGWIE